MAISNVVQPIKQTGSTLFPQAYWGGANGQQSPVYANAGANLAPTNALNSIKGKGFTTPIKSISTKPDGSTTITSHTPTDNSSGGTTDSTKTSDSSTPPISPFTGAIGGSSGTGGLMGYGTGQNNNPLVSGAATTQSNISTGTGPAQTAQTGLQNIATSGSQAVIDAQNALKDFQQKSAGMLASLSSNPNVAGDVASSRNNAVAQNLTAQYNALTQNLQNALSQQGQQITAGTNAGQLGLTEQGQQITAAQNVGGLGTQQQAQNIGALGTVVGATAPTANFPFVFHPDTGTITNASVGGGVGTTGGIQFSGNVQQDAQTAAQAVINKKMTYQQAQQSMKYAGPTSDNFLNSAILNAGGDVAALEAEGTAKQSNITTTGTAVKNAANTGYAGAIQERGNADASYSALTGISSQVSNTLANWQNNGTLTDLNAGINSVASHLSNPDYQKFITALGNAQASYQSILGSAGVTPTKADQDAMKSLDPSKSASTIIAALNQLSQDAHTLIVQPAYDKVSEYESQLGINQ